MTDPTDPRMMVAAAPPERWRMFDRTTRTVIANMYCRYRAARAAASRRLIEQGEPSVSYAIASAVRAEAWNALQASKRVALGIFD